MSKFRNALSWVRHRTTHRYHVVRCDGLRPGYHEIEDRMLHSMFGLLVDFVEIEQAEMWWACSVENTRRGRLIRRIQFWKGKRRPSVGISHLDWAASLVHDESCWTNPEDERYGKLTPQAIAAVETKALYLWWTQERPARLDYMDESGADTAYDRRVEDPEAWHKAAMLAHEIDERNHLEDEVHMKRLVDLRRSLWT